MLPWRLELPNRDRGCHWSKKHAFTVAWEERIALVAGGRRTAWTLVTEQRPVKTPRGWTLKERRRKERRRVTLQRFVGHRRLLSRDADNLRFSVKPVLDALKRLGLIYDDSRTWIDHPEPLEGVSADGTDYTVVVLERA